MGRLSWVLWAMPLALLSLEAVAATQVVARDVRKIGNGNCVASVAVRYNEPIQNPWQQQSRLLKTSRRVVPCSGAQGAADGLIRDLEGVLLMQAQRRSDDANAQIRSVTLAAEAHVRSDATSESRLLKTLPAGTRINLRSLTPVWYGITDARGDPIGGFLHYSELAGDIGAPTRILSTMTTACNARVRAQPNIESRVLQSLPCNQPLSVLALAGGWYEIASAAGVPAGRYIHGAVLKPVRNPAVAFNGP